MESDYTSEPIGGSTRMDQDQWPQGDPGQARAKAVTIGLSGHDQVRLLSAAAQAGVTVAQFMHQSSLRAADRLAAQQNS